MEKLVRIEFLVWRKGWKIIILKINFVKFRVIRGVFTWLMIGGFGLIIYGGPLALMLTVGFQFSPYKIFIYKKSVKLIHLNFTSSRLFNLIFFLFADIVRSSKMFFWDYQHWICSVPSTQLTMVSFPILV